MKKPLTVRCDPETFSRLATLASAEGMSVSELVRLMVDEGLARRELTPQDKERIAFFEKLRNQKQAPAPQYEMPGPLQEIMRKEKERLDAVWRQQQELKP